MGKPTGFIEITRQDRRYTPIAERITHFRRVARPREVLHRVGAFRHVTRDAGQARRPLLSAQAAHLVVVGRGRPAAQRAPARGAGPTRSARRSSTGRRRAGGRAQSPVRRRAVRAERSHRSDARGQGRGRRRGQGVTSSVVFSESLGRGGCLLRRHSGVRRVAERVRRRRRQPRQRRREGRRRDRDRLRHVVRLVGALIQPCPALHQSSHHQNSDQKALDFHLK